MTTRFERDQREKARRWFDRDWAENWITTTAWMGRWAWASKSYELAGALLLLLPLGLVLDVLLLPLRLIGRLS